MITFKNITKRYSPSGKPAVDNISFEVGDGELCVLIGPSGCGKTTTLRMVNRMVDATSGQILVNGEDIRTYKKEQLRRSIGYVIQSIGLLPHMRVRDNIAIVPKLLGWSKEERYQRSNELLKLVGLTPAQYSHKYAHELSGGEAQRIGVARALAARPKLLLMDEPFGAVDPLRRESLQQEFLDIQRDFNISVLFVTHDLDEAIRLADKIVLMRQGTIAQLDSPENMLAHPTSRFVRQFIGTDRALKRLGCFAIKDHLRESTSTTVSTTVHHTTQRIPPADSTTWVLDRNKRVIGFVPAEKKEVIKFPVEYHHLTPTHSLKEALSKMLGMGISAVPVVGPDNALVGEIRLKDIEVINQTGIDL